MPQTADETGNAVERTERKASVLSQTFHNISKSIKNELGKGFNIVIPREEFKELQNEIDTSKEKLNKLQAMMERGLTTNKDFAKTTTFKKLQYDIEETSNSLKHLEGEMADMGKYTHTRADFYCSARGEGISNFLGDCQVRQKVLPQKFLCSYDVLARLLLRAY